MRRTASLLLLLGSLWVAGVCAGAETGGPRNGADRVAPDLVTLVDLKDADAATRLALVCLQGIVNRGAKRPLLYCIHTPIDRVWFQDVYAVRGFAAEEKTPTEAIARFADRIRGEVLYDPAQPESINLATTLAGLEDALPATAASHDAARRVVHDLRGRVQNRADAFRWATETLLPRANQQVLAILSSDQVALRDYVVAEKAVALSFDPKDAGDAERIRALLRRYPSSVRVFWGDPVGGPAQTRAALAGQSGAGLPALMRAEGKLLIPGANVGNLSFHARVPAFIPLRQIKRLAQHNPRHYVCFLFSGNGNFDFALGRMRELWSDEARGFLPLGWEVHPALAELAPALLSFYYADARWTGTDQFVMAPSGAGYLIPADAKAAGEFATATGKAARAADLTLVCAVDLPAAEGQSAWAPLLQTQVVQGVIALGGNAAPARAGGRPLIGETIRMTGVDQAVKEIQAAAAKQHFILAVADAGAVTPTDAAEIAARLGPDFIIAPPHLFMDLLAERDVLDNLEPQLATAKLGSVSYSPAQPGPEDPILVKAKVTGKPLDMRVVYSLNGWPEFAEPMELVGDTYQATIPALLSGGTLKFRVRVADLRLVPRTQKSDDCTLQIRAPDQDGDGLSDVQERVWALDPGKPDTDGDGLRDGNDPAPAIPFQRLEGLEGPVIAAIATVPRTPPAAAKRMALQALVFDPAGVESVSAKVMVGDRQVAAGAMKEVGTSQRFEIPLPTLEADQKLTATITATAVGGKKSEATASFVVSPSVRITKPNVVDPQRPPVIDKPTAIEVALAGKVSWVRLLINGHQVAKLTQAPFRWVWDPIDYAPNTHEVLAEAYDDKDQLLDVDVIYVRTPPKNRR